MDSFNQIIYFVLTFAACFSAILLWNMLEERVKSNVLYLRRVSDFRYSYLAIVFKETKALRMAGKTDDEIQKELQSRFEKQSFVFMTNIPMGKKLYQKHIDALSFIEEVIINKSILFGYTYSTLGKKEFVAIQKALGADEKKKEARLALQSILIDPLPKSVEQAMVWLPKLLTKPFLPDPDNEEREIKKIENQFSVFYFLQGVFIRQGISQDSFMNVCKTLKSLHPKMQIAASKSHCAYVYATTLRQNHRKEKMIEAVHNIIATNSINSEK